MKPGTTSAPKPASICGTCSNKKSPAPKSLAKNYFSLHNDSKTSQTPTTPDSQQILPWRNKFAAHLREETGNVPSIIPGEVIATQALGRHVIMECHAPSTLLDDQEFLEETMINAAKLAGATVVQSMFHRFAPQGVSGVVVIAESHLTIHSWPEIGYAAIDVFTCGDQVDPYDICRRLKDALQAERTFIIELRRGPIS